jgi:endonuclease/exonuclease/phosphatase family metal-dependent hydrolase
MEETMVKLSLYTGLISALLNISIMQGMDSPSLTIPQKPGQTSILTLNICDSVFLTEKKIKKINKNRAKQGLEPLVYNPALLPGNRVPAILQIIKTQGPDIVCLQEVKATLPKDGSDSIADRLISGLRKLGYDAVFNRPNKFKNQAGLITAVKSNKFDGEDTQRKFFNPEDFNAYRAQPDPNVTYSKPLDDETGYVMFTDTKIYPLKTEGVGKGEAPDHTKTALNIINTHLPMESPKRKICIDLLLQYLTNNNLNNAPTIICGDFNLFGPDAQSQRAILSNARFIDTLKGAKTLDRQSLPGTFVGFSNDENKPNSVKEMEPLDALFGRNVTIQPATLLVEGLKDDLSNRDKLVSDHLPVYTTFTYTDH